MFETQYNWKTSKKHPKVTLVCNSPNGMGMLPDGRPTASDNQGQWTPASKVSLLKPDGFYGWVQTYSIPGMWEPGGGTIDVKKVVPPSSFDPPLVWMPQDFDNSSGGQLWVDDDRWGPLSGHLLHTSFGKGWMSYMMIQDVEGQIRTLRAALEKRIQERVRLAHPIVPWMVRHAAALITRCRIRPNGKTPLEMIKGHKTNARVTEFGETIFFKIRTMHSSKVMLEIQK